MPIDPKPQTEMARRVQAVRKITGRNQTAMAQWLGISLQRWNGFERSQPLSKEVAFLLVGKIPGLTTDWLFLGRTQGLTVDLAARLNEAEAGLTLDTPPGRRPSTSRTKKS